MDDFFWVFGEMHVGIYVCGNVHMWFNMFVFVHVYESRVKMCVCEDVCMYVCMHVCVYVCLYVHVCMDVCMYACMYVCM